MGAKGEFWAPIKPCCVASVGGDEGLTVGYSCRGMPCSMEGCTVGGIDCEASWGGPAGCLGTCFGWGGCGSACLTALFSVEVMRFARFDLDFFFRGPRRGGSSAGGLSCLPGWVTRRAKIIEEKQKLLSHASQKLRI